MSLPFFSSISREASNKEIVCDAQLLSRTPIHKRTCVLTIYFSLARTGKFWLTYKPGAGTKKKSGAVDTSSAPSTHLLSKPPHRRTGTNNSKLLGVPARACLRVTLALLWLWLAYEDILLRLSQSASLHSPNFARMKVTSGNSHFILSNHDV